MSHASPIEIHDHAYGFKPSPHVAECGDCLRVSEALVREREAIHRALDEDAPEAAAEFLTRLSALPRKRSATFSIVGLTAAAVFLAGLAWLLSQPALKTNVETPGDASRPGDDEIDRLIVELKSGSPLRREIAAQALKAYGESAVEKLQKAGAQPSLIEDCRGITPDMRGVQRKLDHMNIDLAFENAKLEDILAFVRDSSGLNLIMDAEVNSPIEPDRTMTFKAKSVTVGEALKQILAAMGADYRYWVTEEAVVLITRRPRPLMGLAPIRVSRDGAAARPLVGALSSDSPEERDRSVAALRRLGFAAEPALWKALDSENAEARSRAADLLRSLYTIELTWREKMELMRRAGGVRLHPAPPGSIEDKLQSIRITIDMQNAPLTAIVDYMSEVSGLSFAYDTEAIPNPDEDVITFKVQGIVMDGALKLMLGPRQIGYVAAGDVILLTNPSRLLRTPQGPFWTAPAAAKKIEFLIEALASPDPERQRKAGDDLVALGTEALGPLLEATRTLPPPAGPRCRAVAGKIGAWLVDEPSGVDLQTPTEAQRKILQKTFDARTRHGTLKELLDSLGVKSALKAGAELKPHGVFKEQKLVSLLKVLTRPYGLDFYLDGETVVIDTAANVRAAVEK